MANFNEQERVALFVTHVAANEQLLNIWAQRDKEVSMEIEALIQGLTRAFKNGVGCVNPGQIVNTNTVCCAYHEDNFYRARVIQHFIENNQIQVQFIDYGNIELIHAAHIRLLSELNEGLRLQNIPPNVQRYTVLNILPITGKWEPQIVRNINEQLRYTEFDAVVSILEPKYIFKLIFNFKDYFDLLVQNKFAMPASREQMQMLHRQACEQIIPKTLNYPQPGLSPTQLPASSAPYESTMNNNYANSHGNPKARLIIPPGMHKMNQHENWRQPHQQTMYSRSMGSNNIPIIRKSEPLPESQIENLVFKHRTLEVSGVIHDAIVSDVDNDLPLKFNVQLLSCSAELESLMRNINCHSLEPLSEPPLPGTCCLGRHSETKQLRRAVVQGVIDIFKAKVYYVDFGGHDTLQHSDIFKLPAEYVMPQVLSIRFTLSGLRNLIVSEEMKEYFKKLVLGKPMKLKVMPNEDSPLIRYCILYDKTGKSILDILIEMFPNASIKWPECYSLTKKSRESIHVSYIDSCSKFFVQLDKEVPLLESLADHLASCVASAPPMKHSSIMPGVKCLAHCATDSLWYRAEIVKVEDGKVLVHYVDYGNEELLPFTSIKSFTSEMVTKIPAQAIKCILTGFENASFNEEIVAQFEQMVLNKPLVISVLDILPKGYVVEVYDVSHKPIINISSTIRNGSKEPKTNNSNQISQMSPEPPAKAEEWGVKNQNDSHYQSNDSYDNQASKNWKDSTNEEKRFANDQMSDKQKNNSQSDNRFNRDAPRNERFKIRDGQSRYDNNDPNARSRFERKNSNPRYERNDTNGRYDSNNRFERNDYSNRFDRNDSNDRFDKDKNRERNFNRGKGGYTSNLKTDRNSDASWSDKDSNTSRGSGKRGGRGGRRDGFNGSPRDRNRRDNNGKSTFDSDNDRNNFKNNRFNSSPNNKGSRFNSRDSKPKYNDRNQSSNGNDTIETWDSIPVTSTPANNLSLASNSPNIPSTNVTIGAVKHCEIVFLTSPTNFYVHLSPDNLDLNSVMEKISEIYVDGGKTLTESTAKVGMNCIAMFSQDETWYRAAIQSLEPSGALVKFVDYGNTEIVSFDNIKEIQDEFMKLPMQAVTCKLFGAVKDEWDASEIELFETLTAMKTLEAEFISEDKEIHSVLLREVIDGSPQDSYVNKEFCGGVDLLALKESEKNKHRVELPKAQSVPDYAPLNQKWIEPEILYDKEEDVTVTWITNPQNFYCQLLKLQKVFEHMMKDIQKSYSKRAPISEKLEEGFSVVALFEDGAYYRAEIIKIVEANKCTVRYIDFGNCAMIPFSSIFRVDKDLMLLPKVAINCSFKNIVPPNGGSWVKANSQEIDKIMSVEKLKCLFHEVQNDKVIISLTHDGTDLAGVLVEKDLASFDVVPTIPTPPETNYIDSSVEEHMVRVDISCLTGQILRVKVSNVESVNKFHIQLPSIDASEKIVSEFMKNKDPNMLALPSELSVMQKQAIECYYKTSATSADNLRKLIEDKQVIIKIDEVESNRLVVRLYNKNGEKIRLIDGEEEKKISPLCPMPLFNLIQHVIVIHINHSGSIWLQRTADSEAIANLLAELFDYYSVSGQPLEVAVGKLCAAFSFDGNWYRAKVINQTETGALVQYIDYGNTEEISFEGLKVLEPQFLQQSMLAVEVSLTVTLIGTEAEQQEVLNSHLLNKEYYATFYNVRGKWLVELGEKLGMKMSEEFRHLSLVVEETKKPELNLNLNLNEPEEYVVGSKYEVVAFGTVDPTQFWVQRVNDFNAIADLQRKIQAEVATYENIEGVPEDKLICAALYSEDQEWYRAEVIDADTEMVTVRFIDYGNTDVILGINDKIKKLPDSMKSIRRYATKCRLDVVPVGSEDWPESTCEYFACRIQSVESCEIVVTADGNPMRVELVIGDVNIGEELVEKNYAVKIRANEELIDEIFERELDPKSAFISHTNSPAEFWVQEEISVPDLELLSDRFLVAEMFPKMDSVKKGDLCVALFPDDMGWYRAQVISQNDKEINVFFIDYGNSSVTTEIRKIPEDLIGIPPLSKKCRLSLPSDVETWSQEACNEFLKISNDGRTVFILDVLEEGETLTVKLTLDEEDIVNLLEPLCYKVEPAISTSEESSQVEETAHDTQLIEENPVELVEQEKQKEPQEQQQHIEVNSEIEERFSPLGEENYPNVILSHTISPSEFYIQTESQIPELELIANDLIDAGSFLPLNSFTSGTICAAIFPDDNLWYRAEILSHSNDKTEVLYIDYGNSAVTTELRTLPEDLIQIPPLSKLCSLKMPEGIDCWSNEACVTFMEMADCGATMFGCKEHEGINPTYVTLFLGGQDIIESLQPLCGKSNNTNILIQAFNTTEDTSGICTADDQTLTTSNFSENLTENLAESTQELSVDEIVSRYTLPSTDDVESGMEGNEYTSRTNDVFDLENKQDDINLQDNSSQEITDKAVEEMIVGLKELDTLDNESPIDLSIKSVSTVIQRSRSPMPRCNSTLDEIVAPGCLSTPDNVDDNLDMSDDKNNSIDGKKSEQSHEIVKNDASEVLKGPLTPKTPLSEKSVAGVVSSRQLLEAEKDEILIVETEIQSN